MDCTAILQDLGINRLRDLSPEALVTCLNKAPLDKVNKPQVLKISMAWLHEHMQDENEEQSKEILCALLDMLVKPGIVKVGPFEMSQLQHELEKLQNQPDSAKSVGGYERSHSLLSEV